jgi:hypothetical protein
MTLTNARLGCWLPNPYFVALKYAQLSDWTLPGLPRIRHLSYLWREIMRSHSNSGRLLFCSDGTYYDRLGLIELLRRQCSNIYCFDCNPLSSSLEDSLAEVIALARSTLGIEISFSDADRLSSVSGDIASSCLPGLEGRVSSTAVAVGSIHYRQEGVPDGSLIYARATLTADMTYDLLHYAEDNPDFPNDGTSDHWFKSIHFDAYQQLGRYLGRQAALKAAAKGMHRRQERIRSA